MEWFWWLICGVCGLYILGIGLRWVVIIVADRAWDKKLAAERVAEEERKQNRTPDQIAYDAAVALYDLMGPSGASSVMALCTDMERRRKDEEQKATAGAA